MKFLRNGSLGYNAWRSLDKTCHWVEKRLEFRGSGLPFCPRAFWLDRYYKPLTRESYRDLVVMDRGRAIHISMQRWLGNAGILFGNWECPTCRVTLGQPYVITNSLGPPSRCPIHRIELVYQEYALNYKGISGHPDGLIQTRQGFTVLEIKTINSTWFNTKLKKSPLPKHVDQANAYACIIPEYLGLPVNRALIWYISSDHPESPPITFEFSPDPKRFQEHLDRIEEIKSMRFQGKPPKGICTHEDRNPYCPLLPRCGYLQEWYS